MQISHNIIFIYQAVQICGHQLLANVTYTILLAFIMVIGTDSFKLFHGVCQGKLLSLWLLKIGL